MSRSRIRRVRHIKQHKRKTNIILAFVFIVVFLFVAVALGSLAVAATIINNIPNLKNQGDVQNWQTTKIYAADGTLLTNLYYEQDRVVVPLSQISTDLQHAVIAIEDERFYKHEGFDPQAIARAFFIDLATGHIVEGASTLDQQYIKNTILTPQKTFSRKIQEAVLAYQLDQKYTKDQILEKYLNTIYFGNSWYGVETASQNFFGKSAKDLTLPEAALLAGIINAPNDYSPYLHPNKAKERRDTVIEHMLKLKYITREQAKQAIMTPIQVKPISKPTTVAPYFVDYVKKQLIDKYGENVVFKGGLRVYTTIDPKMQNAAENAAWSTLNRQGDPSAALVAIEPSTGYIKAMVGGRNFGESNYNLAISNNRQPGSSFKPFVFTAALENGISPFKTYDSSPGDVFYPGFKKPWHVKNYSAGEGGGQMTIREALVYSINAVYARLGADVGLDKIIDTAKKMGITVHIDPYPAITLGGFSHGPSVLDMASAYSTLANNGSHCDPIAITKVTDSSGKVIDEFKPDPKQVISTDTAQQVTDVLQDVIRRGTGTEARINRPCAGKTGTATDYRDAWFCGYTPDLSAAVWVGYPQGQIPMNNVHGIRVAGGTFPAEIWNKFMSGALDGIPPHDFVKPPAGVTTVLICADTGLLANKYCTNVEYHTFPIDSVPTQRCPIGATPSIIKIPNVVGLNEQDAISALEKIHFRHNTTYEANNKTPRGIVIAQTPSGGKKARQNTVIQLVVSAGPNGVYASQTVKLPRVIGMNVSSAGQLLESMGLKIVDITAEPYLPNKDKQNKVVYQNPNPGSELQNGQVVTIYVNRK